MVVLPFEEEQKHRQFLLDSSARFPEEARTVITELWEQAEFFNKAWNQLSGGWAHDIDNLNGEIIFLEEELKKIVETAKATQDRAKQGDVGAEFKTLLKAVSEAYQARELRMREKEFKLYGFK